jgi:hypothetical protein
MILGGRVGPRGARARPCSRDCSVGDFSRRLTSFVIGSRHCRLGKPWARLDGGRVVRLQARRLIGPTSPGVSRRLSRRAWCCGVVPSRGPVCACTRLARGAWSRPGHFGPQVRRMLAWVSQLLALTGGRLSGVTCIAGVAALVVPAHAMWCDHGPPRGRRPLGRPTGPSRSAFGRHWYRQASCGEEWPVRAGPARRLPSLLKVGRHSAGFARPSPHSHRLSVASAGVVLAALLRIGHCVWSSCRARVAGDRVRHRP